MRNRIYILKFLPEENSAFTYLNIGKILSLAYKNNPQEFLNNSTCNSFNYFLNVLSYNIPLNAKNLIIDNFGILCENTFALNISKFLLELAKTYEVILIWKHSIKNGKSLYWDIDNHQNEIIFSEGVLKEIGDSDEIFRIDRI